MFNDKLSKQESDKAPAKGANTVQRVLPAVDIFETDARYLLVADMPGVAADGLQVELQSNELRIAGKAEAGPRATPHVFEREFKLGVNVNPKEIAAELRDGLLRITLGKSDVAKPRRIAVQSGG